MNAFELWWYQEGCAMRPVWPEDAEEFAYRIAKIAWSNGAYVEREACAQVCDRLADEYVSDDESAGAGECADVIRKRGQQ